MPSSFRHTPKSSAIWPSSRGCAHELAALNLASSEYAAEAEPPHVDFSGLVCIGKRHVVSAPTERVGGNKTYILQAIDALISDHEVVEADGPRNAKLLALARGFSIRRRGGS
jgi:hypothetical protein